MIEDDEMKILIIGVGSQLFGLDILTIEDVIECTENTPVPLSNDHVSGVLNLRGQIVTDINLESLLGLEKEKPNAFSVVADVDGEMFSISFDHLGEVCDINRHEIEALPSSVNQEWLAVSEGVYRKEDDLIVILNVSNLIKSLVSQAA